MAEQQVHAEARGLSAYRTMEHGQWRQYSAVEFKGGWNGVEHFIRQCRAVGYVSSPTETDGYAVLDVLDGDGDIVQDFTIPSSRAFQWIKRKLHLTVADSGSEDDRR